MDGMNVAIIMLLSLLAVGVVVSPLLRMRYWLKKSPPAPQPQPPSDDSSN